MNVLYVTIDDLSRNYAWKTHVAGIVNSCARAGVAFELIAFNAADEDFPFCRVRSIRKDTSKKLASYLTLALAVLAAPMRMHYDAIYVRGVTPLVFVPLFRFLFGTKVVVEVNGFLDASRGGSVASFLETATFRSVRAIVTVSETFRTGLRRLYGIRPTKVHVIPNGADISLFTPGNNPPVPTAVFVGSFYPHHAADVMLEAVSGLGLKLLLVGAGKPVDVPGFEFMGEKSHSEVSRIMKDCTFGLFCIRNAYRFYGPSTVKLYEYMACGKPVVVLTNVRDVYDFISENGIGLVGWMHEDGKDAGRLRHLLERALSEDLSKFGTNGRRLAESFYNWERAGRQTREMLAELI